MKNSVGDVIAGGFLLSLCWASIGILQARQSGSATTEQNLKFQPQLVKKTVSVINPPARGSITTILKGTELAPNASGQAKLEMGDVEVTVKAQANGVGRPAYTIVLEVPAGGERVVASCEFLKGGSGPIGDQFQPLDTGAGYPPQ